MKHIYYVSKEAMKNQKSIPLQLQRGPMKISVAKNRFRKDAKEAQKIANQKNLHWPLQKRLKKNNL